MSQVTIYLDEDTEARMRSAAQSAGIPVSRWISRLIQEHTRTEWPPQVRELAGVWNDFPDAEGLRADSGTDSPREPL